MILCVSTLYSFTFLFYLLISFLYLWVRLFGLFLVDYLFFLFCLFRCSDSDEALFAAFSLTAI